MTAPRALVELDITWSEHITPTLRASVRQLHSWTAGFPASTSDAPPDTQRAPDRPDQDVGDSGGNLVRLTKVEQAALTPDAASVKLRRIHALMARITFEAGTLAYLAGTEIIPPPARRFEAELAYVQFHVNQLIAGPINKTPVVTKSITHLNRQADELAKLIASAAPAVTPERFVGVCHAHEAANMHAHIDAHYTREHLCRWCGDFRKMHSVNPPVKLIKLHDRGIRITNTHLRANGIRVAS